ncbi:hypothetical protein [Streptomyces albogriseolus]|uniref:hypothetical protein n=1 Tax=Streptomyces albogriseolus TaxID=1887 RepID=UPI0036C2ED30
MSAPLVVNTRDGVCWTRRVVTSGGIALYAPESVRTCPDFVMATEAELAEHGIVGSAYALPMPVAPEPQKSASPKVVRIVAEVSGTESLEDAQYAESRVEYTLEEHGYEARVWIDTDGEQAELCALRARVAELEALKPAPVQTCRTCGAGYTYGQPCSNCQFNADMAAAKEQNGCPRNVIDGNVGGHLYKHGAFVDGPMRCMYCGGAKPEGGDAR